MSQKINANALRLGISRKWASNWFAEGKIYEDTLHADLLIRKLISKKLKQAGLDRIEIGRKDGKIEITAFVARPGVAIGRGGEGIEQLNKEIKAVVEGVVDVKINEVQKPDLSASIIASEIASGLVRRMSAKSLAMNYVNKAKAAGAKGIRIWIGGRINGAQQARTIKFSDGPVPLHTIKADIDYAGLAAETKEYGKFGIKVWVNKPESSKIDN